MITRKNSRGFLSRYDTRDPLNNVTEEVFYEKRKKNENQMEDAVEGAITECIREGILAEFLSKNRAEAKRMSIYEYDEERHMRQTRAEGYEDGEAAGR